MAIVKKPRDDYPLTIHPSGRLSKKHNQKITYYGRWGRVVSGEVIPYEGIDLENAFSEAEANYLDSIRYPRGSLSSGISEVNSYMKAKFKADAMLRRAVIKLNGMMITDAQIGRKLKLPEHKIRTVRMNLGLDSAFCNAAEESSQLKKAELESMLSGAESAIGEIK